MAGIMGGARYDQAMWDSSKPCAVIDLLRRQQPWWKVCVLEESLRLVVVQCLLFDFSAPFWDKRARIKSDSGS